MNEMISNLVEFSRNVNPWFTGTIVFVFGAIFGSFINVLIYRLPMEMDVIFKPSFCPHCKNNIKWYHNIPILSFIFLKGKCAYCGGKISWTYPLVELFTAVCFVLFFILYGLTWDFFVLCLFFIITFPVVVIDFKYQIIPDELSIGGALIGLLLALLHTFVGFDNNVNITVSIYDSLLGVFVGVLIFFAIYYSSLVVFKKEGMGMGDVKFAATIGAFLGAAPATLAFLLSFIYGSIFGIFITAFKRMKNMKKINAFSKLKILNIYPNYIESILLSYVYNVYIDELKNSYIAFGPYMVLGAWTSIFFANYIISFIVGEII